MPILCRKRLRIRAAEFFCEDIMVLLDAIAAAFCDEDGIVGMLVLAMRRKKKYGVIIMTFRNVLWKPMLTTDQVMSRVMYYVLQLSQIEAYSWQANCV